MENQRSLILTAFSPIITVVMRSLLTLPILILSADILIFLAIFKVEKPLMLLFTTFINIGLITGPENNSFYLDGDDILRIVFFLLAILNVVLFLLSIISQKLFSNIETFFENMFFWKTIYSIGFILFLLAVLYDSFFVHTTNYITILFVLLMSALFHYEALLPLGLYLSLKNSWNSKKSQ